MENLCLCLIVSLFSTLNQQSNIGSLRPNHLDLVLTNNCAIVLGTKKALGSFQLCDPETVKTQEWLLPGDPWRLCFHVVSFPCIWAPVATSKLRGSGNPEIRSSGRA